jgi:hypothetical protein
MTRKSSLLLFHLLTFVSLLPAQEVVKFSADSQNSGQSLAARMTWAGKEAERRKFQDGYWVGYSIQRLMQEGSFFSYDFSSSGKERKTLEERLFGTDFQSDRRTRDHNDPNGRYRKVVKDIAILFRFHPHVTISGKPEKVYAGNIGLPFDAMEYPIVWLGNANHEESVLLLTELFDGSSSIELKRAIVGIAAEHDQSLRAHEFLRHLLDSKESDKLRRKAALFLGEYHDEGTLAVLRTTAESDRSIEVAGDAVFGIARMESDGAIDALVSLAKKSERVEIRKKAVQSLSRYATEKVASTLQDIVYNDKDMELQKQALYALTRTKNDENVGQLIELAKSHPNGDLRKYAVYLLGQSKDPRALDALIDIVKK